MKSFLFLLLVTGIAAAVWYLPAQPRSVPSAPRHFSDPAVVYTTTYLTLHLPNGVAGFPPGTRFAECFNVHVAGKEVVSDGTHTLVVDPGILTHDMDYARQLADDDQRCSTRAADDIARSRADLAASQHTADLLTAEDVDHANAAFVASSTLGNYRSALNQPTGAYGSYGSYLSGGTYVGGNTVNNVTVNQYGNGAGAAARGGAAVGTARAVSLYAPQRPGSGRATSGPGVGPMQAAAPGIVAQ